MWVQIPVDHLQAVAYVGEPVITFLSITLKHFSKASVGSCAISLKYSNDRLCASDAWVIRTGDALYWAMHRYMMCEKKKCAFNTVLVVVPQALKTLGAVVWTAVKVAAGELRWSRCLSALCWWILYPLVQWPVTELIWVVTKREKTAFEPCRSGAAAQDRQPCTQQTGCVCAHQTGRWVAGSCAAFWKDAWKCESYCVSRCRRLSKKKIIQKVKKFWLKKFWLDRFLWFQPEM